MRRSVVLWGPQGCGKTRNAESLREYFGLRRVVELDSGRGWVQPFGVLSLTNDVELARDIGRYMPWVSVIKYNTAMYAMANKIDPRFGSFPARLWRLYWYWRAQDDGFSRWDDFRTAWFAATRGFDRK